MLHKSSEKCKLKQDIIIHQLEWSKSKTLTMLNAGEDVWQQELLSIANGDAKWYSHFGKQFGGFLQN